METFYRQWTSRLGLEFLKIKHAMTNRVNDPVQRKQQRDEISSFIAKAQKYEEEQLLKDVYVTDHTPKQARYSTTNKKDDENFFRYQQALEEYNNQPTKSLVSKKERYERGSLLQKIFDPLAGAERQENGTLIYRLVDKELPKELFNDDKLKAEYEKLKAINSGVLEISEEESDELRMAILSEMEESSPFNADEFADLLDQELGVFKNGEKYDFVRDLKDAYSQSLQRTTNEKILDTIPEHVFWDIKTPINQDAQKFMNPYNSFRKYPTASFFDAREYEEYMDRRTLKHNLKDGVSTYRRY